MIDWAAKGRCQCTFATGESVADDAAWKVASARGWRDSAGLRSVGKAFENLRG